MSGSASVPAVSVFPRPELPFVPIVVNSTTLGNDLELVHAEPVGLDDQDAVLISPFPRDGPLGLEDETLSLSSLKNRSRNLLSEFAWNSLVLGTARVYKQAWAHFIKFGILMGIDVAKLKFDFTFVCQFLVYKLHFTGSLSSILSSRSAIAFH